MATFNQLPTSQPTTTRRRRIASPITPVPSRRKRQLTVAAFLPSDTGTTSSSSDDECPDTEMTDLEHSSSPLQLSPGELPETPYHPLTIRGDGNAGQFTPESIEFSSGAGYTPKGAVSVRHVVPVESASTKFARREYEVDWDALEVMGAHDSDEDLSGMETPKVADWEAVKMSRRGRVRDQGGMESSESDEEISLVPPPLSDDDQSGTEDDEVSPVVAGVPMLSDGYELHMETPGYKADVSLIITNTRKLSRDEDHDNDNFLGPSSLGKSSIGGTSSLLTPENRGKLRSDPLTHETEDTSMIDASPPLNYDTPTAPPATFTRLEMTPDILMRRSPMKHAMTNRRRPTQTPPRPIHPDNSGMFSYLQTIVPDNIEISWNAEANTLYIRDLDLLPRKDTVVVRFHQGWATYVGVVQLVPQDAYIRKPNNSNVNDNGSRERGTGNGSWWSKLRELRTLLGLQIDQLPGRVMAITTKV